MVALESVEAAAKALKVFPLPSSVLFPGTVLPLHIFEPRYLELVQDCLAGDRVMALAQLEPGWEAEYLGRPSLAPICCAGQIAWHESLPDGRWNIILQGVVRARVLEELPPTKLYREIRVQLLPDGPFQGPGEETLRRALLDVAGRVPGDAAEGLLQMAAHVNGGALADVVAAALVQDVERRQALLSELDVSSRLKAVMDDVGELCARIGPARSSGPLN